MAGAAAATSEAVTEMTGVGCAGAHHGEILQGVFAVDDALVRGLVTLPCPLFESEARVVLEPGRREIHVVPAWKLKAKHAGRLALDALGFAEAGARLSLAGNVPVSRGFGSSTSDVVATVRAVCVAVGRELENVEIAKLAVQSELASDPLMFDRAVLFAQRDGVLLEDFGGSLPAFEVVGFSTSGHESGISTVGFPPAAYSAPETAEFEELRRRLRAGIAGGDARLVGRVATASAQINQRHLAVSSLEELTRLIPTAGAVGLQVAHSGDVAGLLFDRRDGDLRSKVAQAEKLLGACGITQTWRFSSS
jgi:uncharacterized protein involved in propanediol utilization